jgi:soluble lytic murein transglycosylase
MPTVPRRDGPEVALAPLSNAKVESSASPGMLANSQAGDLGRAVESVGETINKYAIEQQQLANQVRVDDALNKAKEAQLALTFDPKQGYTNLKGVDALQRPDGRQLSDEYGDKLNQSISQISSSLSNNAQRRAFELHANDLRTQFRGQLLKHESDQFNDYTMSVREGTIANRLNDTQLFYNDPDRIDGNIKAIEAAVYDQGRLLGKSGEWISAKQKEMTSKAHMAAIDTAIQEKQLPYADAYLKKYASQMTADDILKTRGLVTKQLDAQLAVSTATQVMSDFKNRMQTPDSDRAFNLAAGNSGKAFDAVVSTESGGQQFDADGNPLTSNRGAVGVAQVMPETAKEAAKLAGLEWDEQAYKNDGVYNFMLGKAYFEKQLQDFKGNLAMAYAAYNAGPGATNEAVQTAKAEDNPNWLEYLPKETQDYVATNLKKFNAGDGTHARPTLEDVHNEVRARIGTGNPERMKLALEEATHQFEDQKKAIEQRDDEATASAMQWVTANGGNYASMPAAMRNAIPYKNIDTVMNYSAKLAKGEDVKTNLAVYQKLTTDPDYLRKLNDSQFFQLRTQLSQSDFEELSKERGRLLNGTGNTGPEALNSEALNHVLNDRLRTLGIDPTPKDGSDEAGRVGAIRQFVRQSIFNAQTQSGKKLNDAEVEKHIDGLFAKSVTFRNSFLGIGTGTSQERLLGLKKSDIPSATLDALKADFKAQGIDKPTDADLLGAYLILKNRSSGGAGAGRY